jgi:predicted DsbA family dithiol-disulfide isomerase
LSVRLIDVYADIVCRWCFIGFRRLNAAAQSTRAGDVAIHHRPFMIHPDAPPEGIDLWTILERKYRTDRKRLFERVEAAALETGIPLDLWKPQRTYSTISAYTLLRHAGERGTQHALTDSLLPHTFSTRNILASPKCSRRLPRGMDSLLKK